MKDFEEGGREGISSGFCSYSGSQPIRVAKGTVGFESLQAKEGPRKEIKFRCHQLSNGI